MGKFKLILCFVVIIFSTGSAYGLDFFNRTRDRDESVKQEIEQMQSKFEWWPTDAKPGMVKDHDRGGYWWWPTEPGQIRPWGNRGYVYLRKIIYDYKAEEETPIPAQKVSEPVKEMKPSLLVKKIIRNVKVYFDYNKADLRKDHYSVLDQAVGILGRNKDSKILITGNCDRRGSAEYNLKLGKKRGESVRQYMIKKGITEDRIIIVSRGKLDAVAPITDLVGMQKDRNAQFMIAEVDEIMLPSREAPVIDNAEKIDENKYLVEKEVVLESSLNVDSREYIVKKGDTLSKIAKNELGGGHRWKILYEFNKGTIKDPNKLKVGQKILIPVE